MIVCKDHNAHYVLALKRTSRYTTAIVLANKIRKVKDIPNREFDPQYKPVHYSPFMVAATWLTSHINMTDRVKKELEMIIALYKGKIVAKAAELAELGEVPAEAQNITGVEDLAGIPMKGLVKLYNATLGKDAKVKEIEGCEGDIHVAAHKVWEAFQSYEVPVKPAKVPKEKKVKEPKAPRDPNAPRRNLNKDAIITVLVEANPKRGASAERFAKYVSGQTVAQAIEAGVTTGDIHWDTAKGFISVTDPETKTEE